MNNQIDFNELLLSYAFHEFLDACSSSSAQNILRVAGVSAREIYITQIIAWLLTPRRGHGLGDGPLRKLLSLHWEAGSKELEASKYSLQDVEVFPERKVNIPQEDGDEKRKIDIVIECHADKTLVVIENKIWSGEGDGQLRDYDKWASMEAETKDWRLLEIYLTPFNKELSFEARGRETAFRNVTYERWIPLLKSLAKDLTLSQTTEAFLTSMEHIMGVERQQQHIYSLYRKLWRTFPEHMAKFKLKDDPEKLQEKLKRNFPDAYDVLESAEDRTCLNNLILKDVSDELETRGKVEYPNLENYVIGEPSGGALWIARKEGESATPSGKLPYYAISLNYRTWIVGVCRCKEQPEIGASLIEVCCLEPAPPEVKKEEWEYIYKSDCLEGLICLKSVGKAEPDLTEVETKKEIIKTENILRFQEASIATLKRAVLKLIKSTESSLFGV